MRILEISLSLINFLSLLLLIFGFRRKVYFKYCVRIGLAVAVLQIMIEGIRWQMIPAYLLTAVWVASWEIDVFCYRRLQKIFSLRLLRLSITTLLVLTTALAVLIPLLLPVFRFPVPSGSYPIGTVTYHLTDSTRRELFSRIIESRRELMVQFWYPARNYPESNHAPYVEDAKGFSIGMTHSLSANGLINLPDFFFNHFKYIQTNAIPSAPIASGEVSFPVIFYLTGLDGFRQANMFQIQHLVSHGFVVVGIDQPFTAAAVTYPDGRTIYGVSKRQIQSLIDQSIDPQSNAPVLNGKSLNEGILPYLAQDVSFVINQLEHPGSNDLRNDFLRRLDLEHVGVFGVSLGAMAAAQACFQDGRLKACLMMDAAMPANVTKNGLKQSGMWITRLASDMRLERTTSGGWSEKDILQTLSTMQQSYFKTKSGNAYYVTIPGTFHLNFTDATYWSPITSQIGLTGPIDNHQCVAIINSYSLAFFNKCLKNSTEHSVEEVSQDYPKAEMISH